MTMLTLMQRLGARVRNLRQNQELTQESLAERAGIVPAYVSAIECVSRPMAIAENGTS